MYEYIQFLTTDLYSLQYFVCESPVHINERGRLWKVFKAYDKLHNIYTPNVIYYNKLHLVIESTERLVNRKRNSAYGPAVIEYYLTGEVLRRTYYINDILHNEHGPAVTEYYATGATLSETYFINNRLHNKHGPVITRYNPNGTISYTMD